MSGAAWRAQANCLGLDPEVFFPERGESIVEAREVCAMCTVRVECLEFAIEHNEKHGIWGGLSERQRRSIRRDRNVQIRIAQRGLVAS